MNLQGSGELLPSVGGCTSNLSAFRYARVGIRYYHITAGHCRSARGGRWYQGGRLIGRTVNNYAYNGSAMDLKLISASRWRTSNYVYGSPTYFREFTQVQQILENRYTWVCKSGIATGVTCGLLVHRDFTFRQRGGPTFRHQRLATYISARGDSGSAVYRRLPNRKAMAVGIHSGHVYIGDTRYAVYTHLMVAQRLAHMRVCLRGRVNCGR